MKNRYKILLSGVNRKINFNKIIALNINIYDVKIDEDKIYLIIDKEDYDKLKNIKCKIVDSYGTIKVKHIIKKNYIILLGILISCLLVFLLSNIIFNVEVNHSNKKLRNIILKDLKKYGISKYKFKVTYKKQEQIKKRILNKERNLIDYLEIKNIGTKYIVELEERKEKQEDNNSVPRHIVAKYDALIIDIDASVGEIVKKKYDYVKQGDIIVSGIIHNKEKEVSKVKSEGKVIGELWYKVKVILPKIYEYDENLKKRHKIYTLRVFNHDLNIRKYKRSIIKEDKVIFINRLLPISIHYLDEIKTRKRKKIYNDSEAKKKAMGIATEKVKNQFNKGDKILEKQALKITRKNSKIEVDIFLKVQKDITEYISIENVDLKEGDT